MPVKGLVCGNSTFILGHLPVGEIAVRCSRPIRVTPNTNELKHPDLAALDERQETRRFKSEQVITYLFIQLRRKLDEFAVLIRGTELTFEECSRTPEVIQNRTIGL